MTVPVPYNSRYSQGTLTRLVNTAGVFNLTILRTIQPANAAYTLYTWKPGDRPDTVAAARLGNSQYWWAIFDYNPEIINPFNVPSGTVVRIPNTPIVGHGTLVQ
jgi:hypothetical protein